MDTVKNLKIVNVSQSLVEIRISWERGQELFSLKHSKMLYFDCGEYGIPYSSHVAVEIRNGSETTLHDFLYSSQSLHRGNIVVQPVSPAPDFAD